ncbi:MAG: thioredoxin-like domain-containing protein, partial [Terrimicrobiaceae bacterium]
MKNKTTPEPYSLALLILLFAVSGLFAQDLTSSTIAGDRSLWPKSVVVSVPIEAPIIIAGKASGSMKFPAGREYPLSAVGAESVTIDVGGSQATVAAVDTDLLVKAAAVKEARDAQQAKIQAAAAAATPTPAPLAASATPTPAAKPKIQNAIGAQLTNLVALDGKKVGPFKSDSLASKKFIAVYYSASWCGPCRNFTPDLVKWYKRNASKSDLFELVFVSADRSEAQMQEYMVEDKMPWPAL